MQCLTMHLYKGQPTRKIGTDKLASEWLAQVYKQAGMPGKWKRADELTLVGGFVGFQYRGTEDPDEPISILLWGADQLAYWVQPDDPTRLRAVATRDVYDSTRRLRLWCDDTITTYQTKKGEDHVAKGGTQFKLTSRKHNPYEDEDGEPILPFSFAHWEFPTTEFSTNSLGLNLKELNRAVNERLDITAENVHFQATPIGLAEGVDATWTPPAELRPGDFITLPASDVDVTGAGPVPTLRYLAPELGVIDASWLDLNNFLDHSLEMFGVPPALMRMIQSGARSGVSIQAEQQPVIGWVEGRRSLWSYYEEDAAKTCLRVAAAHLRNNDRFEPRIQAALEDWQFTVKWPSLYIQLPGPEKDRSDEWRLQMGLTDKIQLLMEREDLSEQEAVERFEQIQARNQQLQAMGVEPGMPQPAGALGGFGGFGAAGGAGEPAGAPSEFTPELGEGEPPEGPASQNGQPA
jgi:hypothetical protein